MKRVLVLPLCLLAGCTSLGNPGVSSDYFEAQYQGARALMAERPAFSRLDELAVRWSGRADPGGWHALAPWDRAHRETAGLIAGDIARIAAARDAVLGQRDLVEVMSNALRDLESEIDAVTELLLEEEAPAANLMLATEQKYLARRMQHSLAQMSAVDMSQAAAAADTFGRDVGQFQRLLDAAINGSGDLGVFPPDNPEVEDAFAQIEELFTGYVADSAEDILENVVYRHDAWLALQSLAVAGKPVAAVDDATDADGGTAADDAGDEADEGVDEGSPEDDAVEGDVTEDFDEAAGVDDAVDDEAESDEAEGDEAEGDDAGDMPEGMSL